jgi:hypothetical protein
MCADYSLKHMALQRIRRFTMDCRQTLPNRVPSELSVNRPVEILATTRASCLGDSSGPSRLHELYRTCYLAATCRGGERGTQTASFQSRPYIPRPEVSHPSRLSFIAYLRCRSCAVGRLPGSESTRVEEPTLLCNQVGSGTNMLGCEYLRSCQIHSLVYFRRSMMPSANRISDGGKILCFQSNVCPLGAIS